ncbi:MAG TPA: hypothetical protein VGR30_16765 [Candidatus Binatia bacterium]|nr:hypothetical protein [Candidatus Binatia bacterium]
MNRRQIDTFFQVLSEQWDQELGVLLTGAAAGTIWGQLRPSMDVDFGVQVRKSGKETWEKLEAAIERTVRLTGTQANYAEDIDRWGLITLLDYKRHTHPYRRFGSLRVRLLDPAYWSIGKMTRYLDPDVRDMIQVFKRQKVPADRLARLWGRALKRSPRSAALIQFRRQVDDFLRTYGPTIWGKKFDLGKTTRRFYREAGITLS